MVVFDLDGRTIRFSLPSPKRESFKTTPSGRWSTSAHSIEQAYQQELRSRWRALFLNIKAKLVAVEAGIRTVEQEFFADIVLANSKTLHEQLQPQMAHLLADRSAEIPLLPSPGNPGPGFNGH